ncbi:MAG: N-acetylmuramoyl-L-alanine amidase [Methyloprofundus sp.]|nr:N-acetylmuramoyl-L-alanine amidase [Methyloprofundus sp.]
MKVALVVGHSKAKPGAVNQSTGITEYAFNSALAKDIQQALASARNIETIIITRSTYAQLPRDINAINPTFIISLHCNAFNRKASGTETLYYKNSRKGEVIAKQLQKNIVDALGLNDRGVIARAESDRGGYLLHNTRAPACIAEPFFIDNDDDLRKAILNREALINAFAQTIKDIKQCGIY